MKKTFSCFVMEAINVFFFFILFSLSSCQRLPLTTGEVGGKMAIVDSQGARVKMACVNWYGAHMEGHVVNGLDRQSLSSIANTIKEIGFNCVRLPFSLEQYYQNPYVDVRIFFKSIFIIILSCLP